MHGESEDIADSGLTIKGLAKKATKKGTAVLLYSSIYLHIISTMIQSISFHGSHVPENRSRYQYADDNADGVVRSTIAPHEAVKMFSRYT